MANPEPLDVATSSEDYARRFSGQIGSYFLEVQERLVTQALSVLPTGSSVLEIGGGHGQLLGAYDGFKATIHGSSERCLARVVGSGVDTVVAPFENLSFPDSSYDAVVAIRLMAHVEDWRSFVKQLTRISRRLVVLDFAPLVGFNLLTPVLFQLKKAIEGNTRNYSCQTVTEVTKFCEGIDLQVSLLEKQFFFPMGIHRLLANRAISERLELVAEALRLTKMFGSPAILAVEKMHR